MSLAVTMGHDFLLVSHNKKMHIFCHFQDTDSHKVYIQPVDNASAELIDGC